MAEDSHHQRTYDVSTIASANLAELHELVTRSKARIEITRPGSDDRCILICREELESLERALAILSDTDDVRNLRVQIAQLAARTQPAVALNA